MKEEAVYPASFCVWDQDQRANPPLDEESRAKGEDGQVGVRPAKTISNTKRGEQQCRSLQLIELQTWQVRCNQVVTCVCASHLMCIIMCMCL